MRKHLGQINSKVSAASGRLVYLQRALRLILKASRFWTVLWFSLLLIQGLLPAVTVYLTKILVDALAIAIGSGLAWSTIRPVVIPAALMAGTILLTQVLQGVLNWIRAAQSELVEDHIKALVHDKASTVDLEFYETPEQSDRMARANSEATARSISLLDNLGALFQNSLTLIAVAALLLPYSIWLPLVLLCSTLPALWVVIHHNLFYHDWWERTTEQRRWGRYFDSMLTYPPPAAEIRLFGLARHFRAAYNDLRRELREGRLRLIRNQNLAQFGAGLVALLVTVTTLIWMGARALAGAATLGDLALFYQAFNQGQRLMRSLLGSLGQLYADALFLEHLFTFLDLQPVITAPDNPAPIPRHLDKGIVFKNVNFRYPGSENLTLTDFNLVIPAGKTIAFVGPNGAGKTTVTKLLCRFYDPTEGSIQLDDVNIREMDPNQLRRKITVMFQNPVHFVASVAENIAMGDLEKPLNRECIHSAATGSGTADIVQNLPNGYETLLGKQFQGGVELSEGEWQRIALARAFYRQAPVVILDEPTSFMDSWAEAAWLDRFGALVKGRTAILVTHRFTTAMRADIIHVMDRGSIVESGSHSELLDQGGMYAASWLSQMQSEKR